MSSRARLSPTFPAPTTITYTRLPPCLYSYDEPAPAVAARTASCSMSIAIWVGHTVFRPCSSYHLARAGSSTRTTTRSEEHTSELQSLTNLVCRLLLEKK